MVKNEIVNVNCEMKSTKRGSKYLEFKCPFCKVYTRKGEVRKRGGDVYHNHGISGDNPTQRSAHCLPINLKDRQVDYEFMLHY